MRCDKCKAEFPFDLTIEHDFDCIFCGGATFPTAEDFVTYPELGLAKEVRPTQMALTKLIDQAVFNGTVGIFEAGTGVGKSYAYLLASILNHKRTVISTAKKSLQSQLYEKDLPLLKAVLAKHGRHFKFAVAYGKSNYICRHELPKSKAATAAWDRFFSDKSGKASSDAWWTWDALNAYTKRPSAPKTHLSILKYNKDHTAEKCIGAAQCKHSSSCTYIQHRAEVQAADVVVTNHWMLGYHIRLAREQSYELLGPVENIIVDEAHKIEDGIRTAFTDTISENKFDKIVKQFENHVYEDGRTLDEAATVKKAWVDLFQSAGAAAAAQTDNTVTDFVSRSRQLHAELAKLRAVFCTKTFLATTVGVLGAFDESRISDWLGAGGTTGQGSSVQRPVSVNEKQADKWINYTLVWRALGEIQDALVNAADPESPRVTYIETNGRAGDRSIAIAPIDVSVYLKDLLKAPLGVTMAGRTSVASQMAANAATGRSVTYLSATLAVAGKFDVFAHRAGLSIQNSQLNTAQFGSAFDLSKQATLYIPSTVPPPDRGTGADAYRTAVATEIHALTEANQGNAFVLFTARDEMLDVAARLQFGPPALRSTLPLLVQDQVSASDLLKQYRTTDNAILFGLKSFWEGIDVVGDKLSLVIITKLPFPGRGDPVVNARRQKAGDLWFPHVDVPDMIFDLRQGIGRLIRTTTDTGVVALLDQRALTKNYSKTVLRSTGFVSAQTQREPVLAILRRQAASRPSGLTRDVRVVEEAVGLEP